MSRRATMHRWPLQGEEMSAGVPVSASCSASLPPTPPCRRPPVHTPLQCTLKGQRRQSIRHGTMHTVGSAVRNTGWRQAEKGWRGRCGMRICLPCATALSPRDDSPHAAARLTSRVPPSASLAFVHRAASSRHHETAASRHHETAAGFVEGCPSPDPSLPLLLPGAQPNAPPPSASASTLCTKLPTTVLQQPSCDRAEGGKCPKGEVDSIGQMDT